MNFWNTARRGMSLAELAFALMVIGAVLGVVWLKVGALYQNLDIENAGKELRMIVETVRRTNTDGKLKKGEELNVAWLPSQYVGRYKDGVLVYNPWGGRVAVFQGNAMGMGKDNYNKSFTVRFDGVPSAACAALVMEHTNPAFRPEGMVGVFILPKEGYGRMICFSEDSYCMTTVPVAVSNMVEALCSFNKPTATVMFTYNFI